MQSGMVRSVLTFMPQHMLAPAQILCDAVAETDAAALAAVCCWEDSIRVPVQHATTASTHVLWSQRHKTSGRIPLCAFA